MTAPGSQGPPPVFEKILRGRDRSMRRKKAIKRISFWGFGIASGLILAASPAGAQHQTDPCSEALGYVGCANLAGETAASVVPRAVGTWELSINRGVWVWTIGPSGTHKFHSEAGDSAPAHAGTISASGGKWSVHALNFPWDDGGGYSFQAPGTMTVAGRLGTGQWRRVH